jgi:hypothetical protein
MLLLVLTHSCAGRCKAPHTVCVACRPARSSGPLVASLSPACSCPLVLVPGAVFVVLPPGAVSWCCSCRFSCAKYGRIEPPVGWPGQGALINMLFLTTADCTVYRHLYPISSCCTICGGAAVCVLHSNRSTAGPRSRASSTLGLGRDVGVSARVLAGMPNHAMLCKTAAADLFQALSRVLKPAAQPCMKLVSA